MAMHRRYGLLILLTAAVVLAVAYASVRAFQPSGVPFSLGAVRAEYGFAHAARAKASSDEV
jgi:hypothetical protein